MNFYKHHLGDYAAATSHLSWDEDCAYRRLLDQYYKREAPLPPDLKDVCRLARAATPAQRRAVETVLGEFFALLGDGWHQKRCDEEIGQASAQADTNRRIAEEREARRRQRNEHEPSTKSLNGSSHESSTVKVVEREPSQTPDSTSQTPKAKEKKTPAGLKKSPKRAMPDDFGISDSVRAWASGKGFGNLDAHLDAFRRKCRANGYAYADWDAAFQEAIREDWAKLRGRTSNGAAPPPESPPPHEDWSATRQGVQARAYELGMERYEEVDHTTGRGVSWASYRSRVIAAHNANIEGHPA